MEFGTQTDKSSIGIIPLCQKYHMTSSQDGLNVIWSMKFISEYVWWSLNFKWITNPFRTICNSRHGCSPCKNDLGSKLCGCTLNATHCNSSHIWPQPELLDVITPWILPWTFTQSKILSCKITFCQGISPPFCPYLLHRNTNEGTVNPR